MIPKVRKLRGSANASSNWCGGSSFPTISSPAPCPNRISAAASPPAIAPTAPAIPVWSLTFMVKGKKHVQHIPKDWVEDVRRRVEAGREFQDAVREVLAANAQLLVLARQQRRKPR